MEKSNQFWYVVSVGANPGIYMNHKDMCKAIGNQKYPRPQFHKYASKEEAELALQVGVWNYESFRRGLPMPPENLPNQLYVVACATAQSKLFTDKLESEAYQRDLEQHGHKPNARTFKSTQMADALEFFVNGSNTNMLENIPLIQYEKINKIFAPENMPAPPSYIETRMRFFARMDQMRKYGARPINPYKYPQPKRLRGKDSTAKELGKEAKEFRAEVRDFLAVMDGKDLSKFDSANDAFTGEFTETLVRNFLLSRYSNTGIEVHRYGDLFNEDVIQRIMDKYTEKDASGA